MTRGRGDTATRGRGDAEMANIRSFKELKVWQNAMDVAMRVFELTKKFPLAQLVRMIDQPDDWTVGANRPPRVPASPGPRVNSRSPRHRVNSRTGSKDS